MLATWKRLRRLVVSIMLVAVTSFVFQGAAMAGLHQHGAPISEHGLLAAGDHVHTGTAHGHDGHVHGHAAHAHAGAAALDATAASSADGGAGSDHPPSGHSQTACCGTACVSAIQVATPEVASPAMTRRVASQLDGQTGSGIDPSGLKRPPRPPSLA